MSDLFIRSDNQEVCSVSPDGTFSVTDGLSTETYQTALSHVLSLYVNQHAQGSDLLPIIAWHEQKAAKTVNAKKRDMHKRYAETLRNFNQRAQGKE